MILGGFSQRLETVVAPTEGGVAEVNVQTSSSKAPLGGAGGELGGLIESRDNILSGFLQQLDSFAGAVINEFNRIHTSGEGLIGFTDVTGTNFVSDTTAALNAAGLAFAPEHGSFQIKVRNAATGALVEQTVNVDLDGIGTDTSLEDLRASIDALDHVSAVITSERKLRITTNAGYEVRFGNDTSGTLAALGINTFFTGSKSDDIAVNSLILADQRYFASGQGGGPGDNTNAVALGQVIDKSSTQLSGISINQFYTNLIGSLGQASAAESALASGAKDFRDSLKTQREQKSGVSIDEEAIQILQMQHNFQAAARIISTVDDLLNTLLQI
ncbi:MAG: hypothetical protein B7Z55_18315 [Planctomycetales bacterium 12-60-4]|nr:MAG: hypothetical protein B7Z55_18315 [Planctomycetales bacterium 12-60-4]